MCYPLNLYNDACSVFSIKLEEKSPKEGRRGKKQKSTVFLFLQNKWVGKKKKIALWGRCLEMSTCEQGWLLSPWWHRVPSPPCRWGIPMDAAAGLQVLFFSAERFLTGRQDGFWEPIELAALYYELCDSSEIADPPSQLPASSWKGPLQPEDWHFPTFLL